MLKKIFLEVDEEITSVIDKLQSLEENEVSLVFPKESNLVLSIINLKLIKRKAEELEKEISIITSNKIGKSLAEQIGLSVSEQAGPKKEEASKELKEDGDKVLIEYKKDPKGEGTEEKGIVFRKESLDDDELNVKEDEEIGTLKNSGEKENNEETKPKNEKTKIGPRFPLKSFFVVFSVASLIIFIAGFIYIPRVTVKIAAASEKKKIEADISIDKNEKNSNFENGKVAASSPEITKNESKKFNSTGKKNIGKKASGTIKIQNTYSTTAQTLVAGTRLQSNGLTFKSTQNADVPGYSDPGGGIVAGSANVTVEAENPGNDYNIGPSSFTISSFQGSDKFTKITGSSSASMSGGETKEVSVVTANDITKAKSDYSKEIEENAKKELKQKIKEGEILKDEALKFEISEKVSSNDVGAEVDQFSINIKANIKGIVYKEDDLKKAFEEQANQKGGGAKRVIESGYDEAKISVSDFDFTNGSFNITIESDAYFSSILDSNKISDEIAGQTKDKSEQFIKSLDGVENVDFKFWPGFLKRVPRIKSHIKIETEAAVLKKDEGGEKTGG